MTFYPARGDDERPGRLDQSPLETFVRRVPVRVSIPPPGDSAGSA